MVLESRPEAGEDPDETHEPPNGRRPFFDHEVWDHSAGAEYPRREIQEEEEWIDEDEWLQAEPEGATRAPSGAGVIIVDDGDVSIETEPARHTGQDTIANCRCRTSHWELRAPQVAGGIFHHKWKSRRDLIDLRG